MNRWDADEQPDEFLTDLRRVGPDDGEVDDCRVESGTFGNDDEVFTAMSCVEKERRSIEGERVSEQIQDEGYFTGNDGNEARFYSGDSLRQ